MDWHNRDVVQATGAPAFSATCSAVAPIPMDTEKPSTRRFPGGIRDEPEERRRHDLRLDHLGAIEARFGHHRRVRYPAGTRTLTVTPVPSRSFAMIALSASSAALEGP